MWLTWQRIDPAVIGVYQPTPEQGSNGTATVAEYVPPADDELIVVKWRASGEFTDLKKRQ